MNRLYLSGYITVTIHHNSLHRNRLLNCYLDREKLLIKHLPAKSHKAVRIDPKTDVLGRFRA